MKKLLILAALAAMTFASCSQNTIIPNTTEQNAISVDVYADRALQTKGLITTAGDVPAEGTAATEVTIKKDGFYMNAVLYDKDATAPTVPNFMYNQLVTFDATNGWTYAPIKYWPTDTDMRVNFYAWAPKTAVTVDPSIPATSTTDATKLSFSVNTDPAQMIDFVAASDLGLSGAVDETSQKPQTVELKFKHELTRLNFSAMTNLTSSETFVVVKSASILAETGNEIYTSGTYTFDTTNETAGTWEASSPIAAAISLANVWSEAGAANGVYTNDAKAPVVTSANTATTAKVPLFAADQYLFLLPVEGTESAPGTTANKTFVEFEYEIVTLDSTVSGGYSTTTATKRIALPAGILQQGIAYNVCFNFGLNAVTIGSVSIDPWNNNDEATVTPA